MKGRLLALLRVLVSAGLLWALLSRVDVGQLWQYGKSASPGWLTVALLLCVVMVLASAWRWDLLLSAQHVNVPFGTLTSSFLVALFFNNFLPSNIGGDVVRIADTAPASGSKTLATTVILLDRGLGLLGLVLMAALGATVTSMSAGPVNAPTLWLGFAGGVAATACILITPGLVGHLLGPLRVFHAEWVGERIQRLTRALARFRDQPRALAACFLGAVVVQLIFVGFYAAIARSLDIPVSVLHLSVIVPMTFLVQMLPISMNGLGVREYAFVFFFQRIGLPLESALLVSFAGYALLTVFSLSGGLAYLARKR